MTGHRDTTPGDEFADDFDEPLADDHTAAEDAMAKGVEALQVAAAEMISAARAMLDVAEELVHDPNAAGTVLGALSSVAKAATRFVPQADRSAGGPGDDDDDGGVRRIPVS